MWVWAPNEQLYRESFSVAPKQKRKTREEYDFFHFTVAITTVVVIAAYRFNACAFVRALFHIDWKTEAFDSKWRERLMVARIKWRRRNVYATMPTSSKLDDGKKAKDDIFAVVGRLFSAFVRIHDTWRVLCIGWTFAMRISMIKSANKRPHNESTHIQRIRIFEYTKRKQIEKYRLELRQTSSNENTRPKCGEK